MILEWFLIPGGTLGWEGHAYIPAKRGKGRGGAMTVCPCTCIMTCVDVCPLAREEVPSMGTNHNMAGHGCPADGTVEEGGVFAFERHLSGMVVFLLFIWLKISPGHQQQGQLRLPWCAAALVLTSFILTGGVGGRLRSRWLIPGSLIPFPRTGDWYCILGVCVDSHCHERESDRLDIIGYRCQIRWPRLPPIYEKNPSIYDYLVSPPGYSQY